MRVKVKAQVKWERRKVRGLKRFLERLLNEIDTSADLELSVLLVDKKSMSELNREYMGVEGATDVLAFPQFSFCEIAELLQKTEGPIEALGDIVICLPEAQGHAVSRSLSERDEVELLAVHGLLHLLGYTDETEEETKRMESMEKKLLGRNIPIGE